MFIGCTPAYPDARKTLDLGRNIAGGYRLLLQGGDQANSGSATLILRFGELVYLNGSLNA